VQSRSHSLCRLTGPHATRRNHRRATRRHASRRSRLHARLIKAIEERVAGAYSPSPGVIYPTLTLLEELGYVTVSTGESAKKLHEITAEGRAFLDANHRTVDALFTRMGEISRAHGGGTAPQILRAMENLKLALRLRLSRGPLNEEQINAAAALIDAAATGVEQIT
jgi:DNA-binding PadR family transcriptional regulator